MKRKRKAAEEQQGTPTVPAGKRGQAAKQQIDSIFAKKAPAAKARAPAAQPARQASDSAI